MPVGAAVGIAGAGLASGAMSSSATKSAGKTVAGATDRAAELEHQRFQELLRLQMPSYNRAESAAGLYSQALGIPSMTARPAATQAPIQSAGQPVQAGASSAPQAAPAAQGMMTGQRLPGAAMIAVENGQPYLPSEQSYTSGPSRSLMTTGAGNVPAPAQVPAQGQGQAQPQGQLDIAAQVMSHPGYQAQLDQGLKAIDRAAPLTGGMYSGRRMKALQAEGQNTFGSYYENWMNRVGGMAGQAPQIAGNIGQAGMQSANNVGNLMMTGANARAQGQQNSANAWGGALGDIMGGVGFVGGQAGWFKNK